MGNDQHLNENIEKRLYFRVSLKVILQAIPVADCTLALSADNAFENDSPLSVFSALKQIDLRNADLLKLSKLESPTLAKYIEGINTKIDMLAQHLLPEFQDDASNDLIQYIDLSEDGASFKHTEALEIGSAIAIRIIFMPNFSSVTCYGRVLRCRQIDTDVYQIATKFERLNEIHRQEIVKQLFKTQTDARKKQ